MDNLNPVPDKNGNLLGFVAIGLAIISVFLFVFVKNYWDNLGVPDRMRLIQKTNHFLESLPDSTSHFALVETKKLRQNAKNIIVAYEREEEWFRKNGKYSNELASALRNLGEQYLRYEGVHLARDFDEVLLHQVRSNSAAQHVLGTFGEAITNLSLFKLTGNINYRLDMLGLQSTLQAIATDEKVGSTKETIELRSKTRGMAQALQAWLSTLEPLKTTKPLDYSQLLDSYNTAVEMTGSWFPELEAALAFDLALTLVERYEETEEIDHLELTLDAIENALNSFAKHEKRDSWDVRLNVGWGLLLAKKASLQKDAALGYDALDRCTLASNPITLPGFLALIDVNKCFASAHRAIAKLTNERQSWGHAQSVLNKAIEILDPQLHQFMWAELKMEMGQTFLAQAETQMKSHIAKTAAEECSLALNVFNNLELGWLGKDAQECLSAATSLVSKQTGS